MLARHVARGCGATVAPSRAARPPVFGVLVVVVVKRRGTLLRVLRELRVLCLVARVVTLGRRHAGPLRAASRRRARTAARGQDRPIRQGRGRVLWGRMMCGSMFRRRIRSYCGGDLGTVDSEVAGINWFLGIRGELVGKDIDIA